MAQHTALVSFLTEEEIESSPFTEDELHKDEWWYGDTHGSDILEGDLLPTHFMLLPEDATYMLAGDEVDVHLLLRECLEAMESLCSVKSTLEDEVSSKVSSISLVKSIVKEYSWMLNRLPRPLLADREAAT